MQNANGRNCCTSEFPEWEIVRQRWQVYQRLYPKMEIKLIFCLKNFPTKKKYYNISTIWFPQLVIEVSFKVCTNNEEIHKWCSPPLLNWRDNSGDMLLLAALLASGNNFQKNVLFAKFLKFPIMSSSLFVYIQRTYTTPSIEEISTNYQKWNFQSI